MTNCYVSCTFDWSVDGEDAGTTVDDVAGDSQGQIAGELRSRPLAVGFFDAQSQLAHVFTVGSHVVSVTVTDELQRTITMDIQLDVAAADPGKPPETDTIGAVGSATDRLPPVPMGGYLFLVGLLSLVAGLKASRRSR